MTLTKGERTLIFLFALALLLIALSACSHAYYPMDTDSDVYLPYPSTTYFPNGATVLAFPDGITFYNPPLGSNRDGFITITVD